MGLRQNFLNWLQSEKSAEATKLSVQSRFSEETADSQFSFLTVFARGGDSAPPLGDSGRDAYLRKIWKLEPIASGACYSVVSKLRTLGWTLEGGRNQVKKWTSILHEAEDGAGWGVFISKLVEDYLTTDSGAFIELGKKFRNGPVQALYHIDAARCRLIGAGMTIYTDPIGMEYKLKPGDYAHFNSLPSPDQDLHGMGFCFVSRALKAIKLLLALHKYESEKLENLPPEGIATITGLTTKQVEKAFDLYKAKRMSRDQLTFPGILWLVGNPMAPGGAGQVKVDLTAFSSLPEQFDRQGLVETYAKTLAACIGTAVDEFWQPERGGFGPSKGEVTIGYMRSKGKGPGEIISSLERIMNWDVLPEGVTFQFDVVDDEDDMRRAEIQYQEIKNAKELAEPLSEEGGIISIQEAREMLVTAQVLPEDYAYQQEEITTDTEPKGQTEKSWRDDRIKIHSSGRIIWTSTRHEKDITQMLRELKQYKRELLK